MLGRLYPTIALVQLDYIYGVGCRMYKPAYAFIAHYFVQGLVQRFLAHYFLLLK
jgi:hypothetical protein